jgi:FMN-dependent NADH-azoreductase
MKQAPNPNHEATDRNAAAEQLPEAIENQLIDAWRREQAKADQENSEDEE